MKYLILFFAFLFPALVVAQTPTLFDEWSPALAGSLAHFQISKEEITITFPSHLGALATIITMPAPVTTPASVVAKSDPVVAKTEKVKLLKVIYDSAQSKGRLFVQIQKGDSMILPFSFLLKDNGEAEIGLAVDPFTMMMGNMKTLKEVEKATRPQSAKYKHKNFGMVLTHGEIDGFRDITFTFYNSSRTAEFAKLKDPTTMPKEEVIGMMNSFGDRLAAELQALPQDSATSTSVKMFSYFSPLFKNIQHIANDLFIAHGYNPLGAAACMEKFKDDSDVKAAGKVLGEKIEQSVPALRISKRNKEIADEENIKAQIEQLNNVYRQRTDLVPNFIEDVKSSEGVDHSVLNKLSTARSNVAALQLTPEIAKDSLALAKFQKAQDDLSAALSDVIIMVEKNPDIKSQENITTLFAQLEGQENRIHVERQRYNEMLANTKYYSFTTKYGEAPIIKFDDSTNSK